MIIKCPYCGYDGGNKKEDFGQRPISIDAVGIPYIICSKCGRRFNIEILKGEKIK